MRTHLRGKRVRRRAIREATRRRRGRAAPPRPPPRPAAPPLRHNSINIYIQSGSINQQRSSRPRCDKTCATAKNYVSQWIRGSGGGGGWCRALSETSEHKRRERAAGNGASQQTRGVRAIANFQSIKSARCAVDQWAGAPTCEIHSFIQRTKSIIICALANCTHALYKTCRVHDGTN